MFADTRIGCVSQNGLVSCDLTFDIFQGRREIWEALRAAAEAEDLKLAQSILDAANITMPTGNPADGCYDGKRIGVFLIQSID